MSPLPGVGYVVILLVFSFELSAHESRPAYLNVTEQSAGMIEINWTRPVRDGRALNIYPVFPSKCSASGNIGRYELQGLIHERWSLGCGAEALAGETLSISGLDSVISDVLLRFQHLDGSSFMQVFDRDNTSFAFPEESASLPNISAYYFWLGVEHILEGFDHLLFVFALLLLVQGLWNLIKTITAFTLAHSITLAGAILGYVNMPSAPVEAVIALSIMFLACELLRGTKNSITMRMPWLIAGVFGLVHGFGFAGALSEIGLPENEIPLALFMFNLGIEGGQILFAIVTITLLEIVRKLLMKQSGQVEFVASYAIGSIASFWLIERVTGFF